MTPTTVACVLRTGGDTYTEEWVYALKRGVNLHLKGAPFVCLTDSDALPGPWTVPLEHDWPGWWSKIELFRPGVFPEGGRVLYLDLDTLILGDLSEIASYDGPFAMLASFLQLARKGRKIGESGVMVWTPGEHTARLYERFREEPVDWMHRYSGDGKYIRDQVEHEFLQGAFPGQVVSLKVHAHPSKTNAPPDGARLVCGHGDPRFSSPDAGWAHECWKSIEPC